VGEEVESPREADDRYESAGRWLREYTRDRDRFPLVFKENVAYGFARNLWGLRAYGLTSSVICIAAAGMALWIGRGLGVPIAAIALGLVLVLVFSQWVTAHWVREAGEAYARALLAVCDQCGPAEPAVVMERKETNA
jgi:hypothetical protein